MPKTLVTGATGFIGGHLVELLTSRGHELCCLARPGSAPKLHGQGYRVCTGDVTDAGSIRAAVRTQRPDTIYHLAGLVKSLSPSTLFLTNRDGTRNVLAAASASQTPATVVIASSLAAAGPAGPDRPRSEVDVSVPVSNYGRSKLAAEQVAAEFHQRVPISVVRPAIVFGPRDHGTLDLFKTIARFGIHPLPVRTPMWVSWIHVLDLVRALIGVAESGQRLGEASPANGIYFSASEQIADYSQMGSIIGSALGRHHVRSLPTPKIGTWTLAAISEIISRLRRRPTMFGLDKAREATAGSWVCDVRKLQQAIDFHCEHALTSTLTDTARWYREAGWI